MIIVSQPLGPSMSILLYALISSMSIEKNEIIEQYFHGSTFVFKKCYFYRYFFVAYKRIRAIDLTL